MVQRQAVLASVLIQMTTMMHVMHHDYEHAYTTKHFDSIISKTFDDLRWIGIQIRYKTEEYQEITNKRALDRESLFCQVGGYVGIMLGVSFLQLPGILISTVVILQTKYRQMIGKLNTNSIIPQQSSLESTQRQASLPTNDTSQNTLASNISCLN